MFTAYIASWFPRYAGELLIIGSRIDMRWLTGGTGGRNAT